jgi:hypothetical protein
MVPEPSDGTDGTTGTEQVPLTTVELRGDARGEAALQILRPSAPAPDGKLNLVTSNIEAADAVTAAALASVASEHVDSGAVETVEIWDALQPGARQRVSSLLCATSDSWKWVDDRPCDGPGVHIANEPLDRDVVLPAWIIRDPHEANLATYSLLTALGAQRRGDPWTVSGGAGMLLANARQHAVGPAPSPVVACTADPAAGEIVLAVVDRGRHVRTGMPPALQDASTVVGDLAWLHTRPGFLTLDLYAGNWAARTSAGEGWTLEEVPTGPVDGLAAVLRVSL